MAIWNNNDREESKPQWLTKSQKINCVRTVNGWELPLHGTSLGGEFGGLGSTQGMDKQGLGLTQSTKFTELLVCMPLDFVYDPSVVISVTGTQSLLNFYGNGVTGFSLTAGAQIMYFNPDQIPAVGSTSGVDAIGKIVAATAGAGTYNIQINGLFNNNGNNSTLGGPKEFKANGILLFLNSATTGCTASVTTVLGTIEGGYTASSLFTNRIVATGGSGAGMDFPNFKPYITCPSPGDSCTGPGFVYNGVGLSFGTSVTGGGETYGSVAGTTNSGYYGIGVYDLSTLNFPGSTAYIKVVANDSNFTQNLTFSLPAVNVAGGATFANQQFGTSAQIYQGAALVNGTIPTGVYEAFFGPTASVNNNIAVLQIARAGATANQSYRVTVRVADNGSGGLTSDSTFAVSFGARGSSD